MTSQPSATRKRGREYMAVVYEDDEVRVEEIDVRISSETDGPIIVADSFLTPLNKMLPTMRGLSDPTRRKARRLEKKFTGAEDAGSKQVTVAPNTGYELFEVVVPPYNMDFLAKLYEKNSTHKAAIDAKTFNIVGLGYEWIPAVKTIEKLDSVEDDEEKLDKVRRAISRARLGMETWLDGLNAEDSLIETLIKVWKDYESTGNGYLEVGRTVKGEIGYIGHVPATSMRIRRQRDGFVQVVENRTVFFRNFQDEKTTDPIGSDSQPNEIIHFKNYTPTSTYYGVPDVISALSAVAGNEFASSFNIDYFEHSAVPRHIIIVKGATISAQSEKMMYEFFDQKIKGKPHRTLYMPLPADTPEKKVDVEIKPVEAGIQEASFIKYKDSNRDEILAAHRVPITKIMLAPGMSLASSRDADKGFKEQVTRPQQRMIERRLNKIFAEKNDVFTFKLTELTLTDEDTQSKIDERYLRYGAVLPNEIRINRLSLPPRDGGDEPWVANPQQAAEANTQANASRSRDSERSAGATDSAGEGRSAKGDGRSTA